MLTKSLSLAYGKDGIIFTSIHPGWVQTEIGTSAATLTTEQSVSNMIKLFSKLNSSHNGSFLSYDGSELPW